MKIILTFESDNLGTMAIPIIEDALGGYKYPMTRGIDYDLEIDK